MSEYTVRIQWTQEEDEILSTWWPKIGTKGMVKRQVLPGRTPSAISARAEYCELKRIRENAPAKLTKPSIIQKLLADQSTSGRSLNDELDTARIELAACDAAVYETERAWRKALAVRARAFRRHASILNARGYHSNHQRRVA